MSFLELQGLGKRFAGGVQAVAEIDLAVEAGEFLVLVGPSGCGKSTLLRLIAGLDTPDEGEIRMAGERVNEREPRERDVAMVFQNYALYPHMSVAANIGFPLKMQRIEASEREARVRSAATTLGIEAVLSRKPAQLSGGQMQRVALARALVRRPRIFLFDEPLSNIDAKLRQEMRAELTRLHHETKATMVYVTHDQVEAMTLGTRIAVLDGGRLQQLGPPLEVYARPANRFVAGFLGAPPMNLLSGAAAATLRQPGQPDDCVIGFRPHQVRMTGAEADPTTSARVSLVERLGTETLIHATIEEQALIVSTSEPVELVAGETFSFSVAPEHRHAFDADGGWRL